MTTLDELKTEIRYPMLSVDIQQLLDRAYALGKSDSEKPVCEHPNRTPMEIFQDIKRMVENGELEGLVPSQEEKPREKVDSDGLVSERLMSMFQQYHGSQGDFRQGLASQILAYVEGYINGCYLNTH